jgi:hypothetical protein
MGWKTLKEHYRIEHIVCVTEKGICIGSPYVHDLIIIGLAGTIIKPNDGRSNADLARYMAEMTADLDKLREVVQVKDTFDISIPVFTYEGGNIVEKKCEDYDWPNVTHDGDLMYSNLYSRDKDIAVRWAKQNAESGIASVERRISELRTSITESEENLHQYQSELAKLRADYP